MKFYETKLQGAWLIEPEPARDERGSFSRTFCEAEFSSRGLVTSFVQHSHSHSLREGTLRGMHFQLGADSEVKLVSCIRGAVYDVIVDLRPASKTYREWISVELSASNARELYVPKGFAHGFMTLSGDVVVSYMISEFHKPHAACGIPFNDPAITIDWPGRPQMISQKDLAWKPLSQSG